MTQYELKTLCEKYSPMNHRERMVEVFRDFDRVLVTSSFGTSSAILLHHLHKVRPEHPVHFVDTTFHFPETMAYKEKLANLYDLTVETVSPSSIENMYTKLDWTWAHKPDECCFANKVAPMKALKATHDVWISGMIGRTSLNRRNLDIFSFDGEVVRFYPFLDMSQEEADIYKVIYELPAHPLQSRGYDSVGCTHCTAPGKGREGRWAGKQKTECGLHLYAHKKVG
ncbi:MAG: phosphoadenylyl-sulfate reductase [Bacteroidota bacterium]